MFLALSFEVTFTTLFVRYHLIASLMHKHIDLCKKCSKALVIIFQSSCSLLALCTRGSKVVWSFLRASRQCLRDLSTVIRSGADGKAMWCVQRCKTSWAAWWAGGSAFWSEAGGRKKERCIVIVRCTNQDTAGGALPSLSSSSLTASLSGSVHLYEVPSVSIAIANT